jgi:membrane associated rhomboid family serine protease
MISAFVKRPAFVILLLFVVCGAPGFAMRIGISAAVLALCYGFLIGWIAAWYSMYRYSRQQPG